MSGTGLSPQSCRKRCVRCCSIEVATLRTWRVRHADRLLVPGGDGFVRKSRGGGFSTCPDRTRLRVRQRPESAPDDVGAKVAVRSIPASPTGQVHQVVFAHRRAEAAVAVGVQRAGEPCEQLLTGAGQTPFGTRGLSADACISARICSWERQSGSIHNRVLCTGFGESLEQAAGRVRFEVLYREALDG